MELKERWSEDDLLDLVDAWHDSPCVYKDFPTLHGFLDFTWDEYCRWVETNEIPWDNFYQLRLF